MNSIIESLTGMKNMSDQVIATDFLISVKSGIRNYAIALTEVTSDNVRIILRKQLNDAIETHEKISNFMVKNGYYHPYDPEEQFNVDLQTTDTALKLLK